MRRVPLPTLLTAGVLVVILLIFAFSFQVRFSEAAVKVRLGKPLPPITTPGAYFRWIWPFEMVQKYDIRLRTLDTLEGEVKTRDGKNIVVGCYALWRIADPLTFQIKAETVRSAEEKLRARINQRRAAVVGNEDLSAFVNLNEQVVNENYDRIQEAILRGTDVERSDRSLQAGVREDFGIELVQVRLRRISLPEETTQSVFQQMSAERQKEAARYREEGKARALTITDGAKAMADQIRSFVERKAAETASAGVQASTRLYEQIAAEDAEFFEWLLWLDALRAALKQKSTIFLDNNSALFERFAAPLIRTPPAATQPAGAAPEPPEGTP